jgi:hypothetical protein
MDGLSLVEAAFDLGLPTDERIDRIADAAARDFAPRSPVVVYPMPPNCDFEQVRRNRFPMRRCDDTIVNACLDVGGSMLEDERIAVYYAPPTCMVAAEVFRDSPAYPKALQRGVADMVALLASTGAGGGLLVTALTPEARRWPAAQRDYWARVGDHLGAAWRLHQSLQRSAPSEPAASFGADGRAQELSPAAAEPATRALLRTAVQRRVAALTQRRSGRHW